MGHTVYIKDRIYIPAKIVDEDELKERYEPQVYNEDKCGKCPYLSDRHCDVCDDCPANLGVYKLYKERRIKKEKYYGINVGNKKWSSILTTTKNVKVKDKRAKPKFRHKIKFIGSLRYYQKPAAKKIIKLNNGVLKAPARSGKTVVTTAAICKKGMRTIIIAKQYDWLKQFYTTIMGDKEKGEPAFTNIPELEEKTGKKICVLAKEGESIEKYKDADIVLSTYQRFLSVKGKKQLKKIKDEFGVLLVDEGDQTAAEAFSKVLVQFSSRARLMCTATTERKDGMYFLTEQIFGPILYEVKVATLTPTVKMIETGVDEKKDYKIISYAYRFLAKHKERNELIVDWVKHDLKSDKRNSIVIPTTTVAHCGELVEAINKKMGKDIAVVFSGATAKKKEDRDRILADAKSGKTRVIVGIRSMVQRGINIPRWNILYNVMPISNRPNYIQETARVLTPVDDKPKPIIRHFIDKFGLTTGCLRGCVWNVYVPMKFKIPSEDFALIKQYGTKSFTPSKTLPPNSKLKGAKKGKKKSKRKMI